MQDSLPSSPQAPPPHCPVAFPPAASIKPNLPDLVHNLFGFPLLFRKRALSQILVRTDEALEGRGVPDSENNLRSLPLALEGPGTTPAAPKTTTATSPTVSTGGGGGADQPAEKTGGGSTIVYYHLLAPEAAVEELKLRWSDLVEPSGAADTKTTGRSGDAGYDLSEDVTPWARMLGVGSSGTGENDIIE